jgi:hypothetical protein
LRITTILVSMILTSAFPSSAFAANGCNFLSNAKAVPNGFQKLNITANVRYSAIPAFPNVNPTEGFRYALDGNMAIIDLKDPRSERYLYTDGLLFCSAILVVDPINQIAMLSHFYPGSAQKPIDPKAVVASMKSAMRAAGGNFENAQVQILWGRFRKEWMVRRTESLVQELASAGPQSIAIDSAFNESHGFVFDTRTNEVYQFNDGLGWNPRPQEYERYNIPNVPTDDWNPYRH